MSFRITFLTCVIFNLYDNNLLLAGIGIRAQTPSIRYFPSWSYYEW